MARNLLGLITVIPRGATPPNAALLRAKPRRASQPRRLAHCRHSYFFHRQIPLFRNIPLASRCLCCVSMPIHLPALYSVKHACARAQTTPWRIWLRTARHAFRCRRAATSAPHRGDISGRHRSSFSTTGETRARDSAYRVLAVDAGANQSPLR